MSFFSGLDTEGYDRQYTDRQLTQRFWTYFGPYRVQLIWVAIFTLLIACAEAAIPVLVAWVVGELSVTGVAASPIFILTGAVFGPCAIGERRASTSPVSNASSRR